MRACARPPSGRWAPRSLSSVRGIGTTRSEIDRFRRLLERRPSAATRLFTAGELAYGARSRAPCPGWPPALPPRKR